MGDEPPQKWEFLEETALGDISGVYLRLLNRMGRPAKNLGISNGGIERGPQACW